MKHKIVSVAMVACLPYAALAQTETAIPPEVVGENTDKAQLLSLLEEQTAIATRTRMNADYVPGMVTVLHGDDLETRGARTVWEALALVPGMEFAMEETGRRKVLVRGLGNIWASGNVKILLNDVPMNSAELGLADPMFNIAIEQVDRIEVIRGPGSAIHGEYAYMGVINVITRTDQSRVFAFGGDFDTVGAGVTLAYAPTDSPLKTSLNIGGWRSSGADVQVKADSLYSYGFEGLSHAPGPASEDIDAATAVFKLDYAHFSFIAQQSQDGLGDHFGKNFTIPPDPNRIVERWRHRSIDMRQTILLGSTLSAGVEMGWKNVERRRDDSFVVPGGVIPDTPDIYFDARHLETTLHAGARLTYTGWTDHNLLLATDINKTSVDDNWLEFSQPIGPAVTIPEGATRTITAITLQDEYRHSDVFTLTTGVRYDKYDDAGTNYSPRIAGVWRLNERHIVKAQYAEAFRPPTLYETSVAAYRGRELRAAEIRTSELGYVFKGNRAETRITAFYSQLDDIVQFFIGKTGFQNNSATTTGLEWEQIVRPTPHWAIEGNISYVDTQDAATGEPFPGAAQWIANVGPSYKRDDTILALQAHYVSGYERETIDPRPELDGYTTVDFTTSFFNVLARGMTVRIGGKNLFDEDARYPAPVIKNSDGSVSFSYEDDYPRAGRSWWAQLGYRY